ncbi:MAG: hypothetical protein JNJ54_06750 [Myxococcaceae bacterium]|nr:hypothetical protein [Myxococcaceae bacterium]
MSGFVNQDEFDALKREVRSNADKQAQATERLTIRAEVMSHDVARLTDTAADITENLGDLREHADQRFDGIDQRIGTVEAAVLSLRATVDQNHQAIMSALLQLAKTRS